MKRYALVAVVLVVVIILGLLFVPQLAHKCDDCGDFFIGTGYEANFVSELLSDDEQVICRKCAKKHHAISIVAGKSVDDFKKKLFD